MVANTDGMMVKVGKVILLFPLLRKATLSGSALYYAWLYPAVTVNNHKMKANRQFQRCSK